MYNDEDERTDGAKCGYCAKIGGWSALLLGLEAHPALKCEGRVRSEYSRLRGEGEPKGVNLQIPKP